MQLREAQLACDRQVADEEKRLERARQLDLDEYEEQQRKQFEMELRRKN